MASKEELAKKIGFYEEEVTVIGEYITRLADDEELRMENLLEETQLGNREPNIIFEKFYEELGDDDAEQDEEDYKTLQYPISVAGMNYFLERLCL